MKCFKEYQYVESEEEEEEFVDAEGEVEFTDLHSVLLKMKTPRLGYVYCLPTIDAQPIHLI